MITPLWNGERWVLTKPIVGSVYVLDLLRAKQKALEHTIATTMSERELRRATKQLLIVEQQIVALS